MYNYSLGHGNFKFEKTKHKRKCRFDGCLNTIPKNMKCLVEIRVEDRFVRGGDLRPVENKLSYCNPCAIHRVDEVLKILENETKSFKSIRHEIAFKG